MVSSSLETTAVKLESILGSWSDKVKRFESVPAYERRELRSQETWMGVKDHYEGTES